MMEYVMRAKRQTNAIKSEILFAMKSFNFVMFSICQFKCISMIVKVLLLTCSTQIVTQWCVFGEIFCEKINKI